MLLKELDHLIAEVPERVGHVGFLGGAAVHEPVGLVMTGDDERASVEQLDPSFDRCRQIVDQVGLLEQWVAIESPRGNEPYRRASPRLVANDARS